MCLSLYPIIIMFTKQDIINNTSLNYIAHGILGIHFTGNGHVNEVEGVEFCDAY